MREILVIGFGNPLRGDDAIGWHCVRLFHERKGTGRIAAALRGMPVYEMASHQLDPELAERVSTAHFVLFIDATAEGTPGEIINRQIGPTVSSTPFHHHVTPELLLTYAKSLFDRCPPAMMLTVCGESFELTDQLSETVQDSLDTVLEKIASILESISIS